jgi:hypothetical protein
MNLGESYSTTELGSGEISVFPLSIDISKRNVIRLTHKECLESVEQKHATQLVLQVVFVSILARAQR